MKDITSYHAGFGIFFSEKRKKRYAKNPLTEYTKGEVASVAFANGFLSTASSDHVDLLLDDGTLIQLSRNVVEAMAKVLPERNS